MKYLHTYESFSQASLNEAASVPSNVLEFAKRKGSYAVALVKKAAAWAEKSGKYISSGTAIGKNYNTIILDMKHQGSEIYINLNDETIELFGEEVTDPKSFKKVLGMNESVDEAYKAIPYNVKIAGKYKVLVGKYPTVSATVTVAGFERQSDDSDSLYLDDSDEFKPMFGGFIVKNSDMKKLEKGITVNAVTSKDNKDAKITRIGDL